MSEDQVDSRLRKRPSISDVALEAGVSRAAVSKVIRNAYGVSPCHAQARETAIDKLAYRPRVAARAMRGASFTIGFEIPHIGNDFFTQIMEGATTGLAASRYQLIIAPGLGYLNETTVLEALVDRQVDGVIAISSDVTADWLGQLAKHVPVVILGRHDRSGEWDTITDDAAGVDLVMDHLLGLGHQRIAHRRFVHRPTWGPTLSVAWRTAVGWSKPDTSLRWSTRRPPSRAHLKRLRSFSRKQSADRHLRRPRYARDWCAARHRRIGIGCGGRVRRGYDNSTWPGIPSSP